MSLTAESTFIKRSIIHAVRTPDALIMATVFPIIMMFLFTFVFGGAFDEDGSYVQYVVPGIILLCAGFGAASVAVDIAQDMTTGIIDRFRTMPIARSAVLTGHVLASLCQSLVGVGVVLGVAVALGFRPSAGPLAWLAAIGVLTLFSFALIWLATALGLAAKSVETASNTPMFLTLLPFLGSAFVPAATMPIILRQFATYQPFTPVTETVRGLLTGTPIGHNAIAAIAWCIGIALASYLWAIHLYTHRQPR